MLLRAATRGSPLALWQAEQVGALLMEAHPGLSVEAVITHTTGDIDQRTPIEQMGGQGVFAKEVQAAVLDGRADIAVHSAKDLMSVPPPGLTIAAFPERGDPRDGLVGRRLADLDDGATVATGSIRRKAQLASVRPDLEFVGLRGNMTTRLGRLAEVDAIVVASAGLDRLGLGDEIAERLSLSGFVPQVAQGTLAVECRSDDARTIQLVEAIDDQEVRRVSSAERSYLAQLGGGCDLPVGAFAASRPDGDITLDAMLSSFDGSTVLRLCRSGADPEALGAAVARSLVDEMGGAELLESRA